MTATEWGREVQARYGKWPQNRAAVKQDVWDFVRTKRGGYLAALLQVLKERRPSPFGPPCLADLMEIHPETLLRLEMQEALKPPSGQLLLEGQTVEDEGVTAEKIAAWPRIEDDPGDGYLGKADTRQALQIIMDGLAAKRFAMKAKEEEPSGS